jgi:ankyrin repeat protein
MKKMYLIPVFVLILCVYLPGQDIFSAIQKGDLASVKALLEKDPTLINSYANGTKPLHFATKLNHKDIAEYLVSKGADINVNESNHLDFTPVTWATRNGNKEMVEMFLENGANLQYRTRLGESYLHFAALFDRKELAEFFIERGIEINTAKNGGLTPMHIAVVAGNIDIVKLLVQKGADLELKGNDGGTPLHFAVAARKDEIAGFLRQSGAIDIPREFPEYKGKYLGMKKPGTVPEAFAPELFLDIYRTHSAPAFSPDGKEIYWAAIFMAGNSDIPRIWCMKEVNGKWQAPQVAPFGDYLSGGPVFSHNGQKLFFFSMRPRTNEPAKDLDLWYVERQGKAWGDPKHLGSPVNEDGVFENDPFLAKDGTLYFELAGSKNAGLYKSAYVNGRYTKPEFLGDLFNSSSIDNCGDMDHIILRSDRRKERFYFELYMSFHLPDGRWSKPIYMGDRLHQGKRSGYGRVTPDGKYIFIERDFSFYWLSSKIIDELRPKQQKKIHL